MAKKADVTVYIGRFSPFHMGHAFVARAAANSSDLAIILIGSSGLSRSLKNPFTFEERREMILTWAASQGITNIVVGRLRDYPYNDSLWIREVQETVRQIVKKEAIQRGMILTDIRITGSDRDESTWYLKAFPQWTQALQEPYRQNGVLNVSATEVREWLLDPDVRDKEHGLVPDALPDATIDFIQRFMKTQAFQDLSREFVVNKAYRRSWESAPYPPTFVTADAAVIQSGHILVVERGAYPGKGLLALPGGFVKAKQRVEDCAIDEVMEETGIRLAAGKNSAELTKSILRGSIRDKELFDAPDRSSRGRTITTAFLMRLDDTKPLPLVSGQNMPLDETGGKIIVETTKAMFIPINQALNQMHKWFEDHHAIAEWAANSPHAR